MISFDKDLFIHGPDIWLDSNRVKDFGFISHGHTDHIARHRKIICSNPTKDIIKIRLKNPNCIALDYNKVLQINNTTISLHPAGHILGSAQIKIINDNTTLLYSGDFRISDARTVEPFEFVKADILIMESTFGLPHYKFPDRSDVENDLITLCRDLLIADKIPVVFAYTLGKGQEVLKILTDAGLPVAADYSILRFIPIYQKYGIKFERFTKYKITDTQGKILLLPVNARYNKKIRILPNIYTIYLSGWAIDSSNQRRLGVDKVMPLSDHADFDELIQLVEITKPKIIYCTHGFDSFVDTLKNAGFNAHLLK